jgi:hypothetical protein
VAFIDEIIDEFRLILSQRNTPLDITPVSGKNLFMSYPLLRSVCFGLRRSLSMRGRRRTGFTRKYSENSAWGKDFLKPDEKNSEGACGAGDEKKTGRINLSHFAAAIRRYYCV